MGERSGRGEVPELLRGCWRRTWIRYSDGSVDDTSTVVWLQLESMMADVRIPAGHADLTHRQSLKECSLDELRQLAGSESSCGYTRCSPIETDIHGVRRATAEWPGSDDAISFQPVSGYPEPGGLEWSADASVMIERAPSGAYVEEWRRVDDSDAPLVCQVLEDGGRLYAAGAMAVLVRDRPAPVPRVERLAVLVAEAGDDRAAVEALVDCEFSLAKRHRDTYVIIASTHPWRAGDVIDVAV